MKKIFFLFSFALWCYATHAESITIHHIGVGQGDATLIVITNDKGETASIVIDGGNSAGKGELVATAISKYDAVAKNKRIDIIITSHLHSDHLGGVQRMMETFVNNGWTFGYIIDRAAAYVSGTDWACYDGTSSEDVSNDPSEPLPTTALVAKYDEYINSLPKGTIKGRYNVAVGLDLVSYFLKAFACKTSLLCLTSNALACNKANGYSCDDWQDNRSNVHNENDYSYSFLLQLGTFKYFTGGDIGGESPYVDLETPLLSYFQGRTDAAKFHFCGYKASHHGSEHSTNTAFVSYTKPTVTVVPSALRSFSGTKLPSQNTLARIQSSSTNSNLYYTYTYNTNPYSGSVSNYMDVILAVDGNSFESDHKILVTYFLRGKTSPFTASSTQTSATIVCNKH
jgi:competence protein ComEC